MSIRQYCCILVLHVKEYVTPDKLKFFMEEMGAQLGFMHACTHTLCLFAVCQVAYLEQPHAHHLHMLLVCCYSECHINVAGHSDIVTIRLNCLLDAFLSHNLLLNIILLIRNSLLKVNFNLAYYPVIVQM